MTWLDDLQRRLAIVGARSLGHEFAGQVGAALGGGKRDVWEAATNEPEGAAAFAGSAPECAWCPVCRAIRMARGSSPELASRVSETAGALMSAAQDAVSAIDAALSRLPGPAPGEPALREPAPQRRSAGHAAAPESAPSPAPERDPGTRPSPNGPE